jgi:hypothetical protein
MRGREGGGRPSATAGWLKELEEGGMQDSLWFLWGDASSLCITVKSFVDHREGGMSYKGIIGGGA